MERVIRVGLVALAIFAVATPSAEPAAQHERPMAINFEGSEPIKGSEIARRLREQGVAVRLDIPLDSLTICVIKEMIRDMMAEKGFVDAQVTHRVTPDRARPTEFMKITFDIVDGARSRTKSASSGVILSPAARCAR